MSLHAEIHEQPDVARRFLTEGRDAVDAVAAALRAAPIDVVCIAARGSSDHAAIYAQYVLGALQRLPVALATPSLTSVYGVSPRFRRALVIGISQSGRSPDIVGVVAEARAQGAATVAITNAADSPLAAAAEHVIDVRAGAERAVAATKSYSAQLLAVAALAVAMGGAAADAWGGDDAARRTALARLPDAMAAALAAEPDAARIAADRAGIARAVILARGFEYATAREWALKLKELAYLSADPYSAADFAHGPTALLEPGFPVLAIAPAGAALTTLAPQLATLRAERGIDLVTISDDPAVRAAASAAMATPAGVAEWLSPIVSILPAQLFAYHLTRARGLDTEQPRGLSKVTLTR